jgi:hypothetical protein
MFHLDVGIRHWLSYIQKRNKLYSRKQHQVISYVGKETSVSDYNWLMKQVSEKRPIFLTPQQLFIILQHDTKFSCTLTWLPNLIFIKQHYSAIKWGLVQSQIH